MKIKLAAFLAFVLLVMAGCSAANTNSGNSNSGNANAGNANRAATAPTADPNMTKANAEATSTTGGTKEGCKCSAAGMVCNSKDGKGCCGGGEACSSMKDGKSACCAKEGKEGDACCSTAGKTASANTSGTGTEKKEPAKKS